MTLRHMVLAQVDDLATAGQNSDPATELLHLHITGTATQVLHTFLDCNFTSKHCQKMEAAINSKTQNICRIFVEVIQPALSHVIVTLDDLLSAIFCDQPMYQKLGMQPATLIRYSPSSKLQQVRATILACIGQGGLRGWVQQHSDACTWMGMHVMYGICLECWGRRSCSYGRLRFLQPCRNHTLLFFSLRVAARGLFSTLNLSLSCTQSVCFQSVSH